MTNINEFKHYIDARLDGTIKRIPTGFSSIDNQLSYGGLPPGTLFYIVGKADTGKTKLLINWIKKLLILTTAKILFLSLEETETSIYDGFLQLTTGYDNEIELDEYLGVKKDDFVAGFQQMGFFDRFRMCETLSAMQQVQDILENYRPDYIFIDHLHLLPSSQHTTYDRTIDVSANLVAIKKMYKTRIICIVQRKRGQGEKYPGAILPHIEDGLGSSVTEHQPDLWMGICRPELNPSCDKQYHNEIHAIFRKNRMSKIGSKRSLMRWRYDPVTTELFELDAWDRRGT